MRIPLIPACAVALLLAGCSTSTAKPTPRPTPRPTPTAAPTPTPAPAPDTHKVDITASGVGAFDLVAVPVAVLHSEATRDLAIGVVVHFTTSRYGRVQFSLDSEAVEVFPGQQLVVTANCTDTCEGADGVTASVTVTTWQPPAGSPIVADPASYACGGACRGSGYGDATANIHGAGVPASATVDLFAECTNVAGSIVGGGQRAVIWSEAGVDEQLDVPVILSAQPVACFVSASPASSTSTAPPAANPTPAPTSSGTPPKPTPPPG